MNYSTNTVHTYTKEIKITENEEEEKEKVKDDDKTSLCTDLMGFGSWYSHWVLHDCL